MLEWVSMNLMMRSKTCDVTGERVSEIERDGGRERDAHRNMHMVKLNHLYWMSVHAPWIFETDPKYASQSARREKKLYRRMISCEIEEKRANKTGICITSYRIALEAATSYACTNMGGRVRERWNSTNTDKLTCITENVVLTTKPSMEKYFHPLGSFVWCVNCGSIDLINIWYSHFSHTIFFIFFSLVHFFLTAIHFVYYIHLCLSLSTTLAWLWLLYLLCGAVRSQSLMSSNFSHSFFATKKRFSHGYSAFRLRPFSIIIYIFNQTYNKFPYSAFYFHHLFSINL